MLIQKYIPRSPVSVLLLPVTSSRNILHIIPICLPPYTSCSNATSFRTSPLLRAARHPLLGTSTPWNSWILSSYFLPVEDRTPLQQTGVPEGGNWEGWVPPLPAVCAAKFPAHPKCPLNTEWMNQCENGTGANPFNGTPRRLDHEKSQVEFNLLTKQPWSLYCLALPKWITWWWISYHKYLLNTALIQTLEAQSRVR